MAVLTVVEGKITLTKQKEFEDSFRAAKKDPVPPGLVASSLLKNTNTTEIYRIQTVWQSLEALGKMRSSTQTPKAVELFLRVGTKPTVEIYEFIDNVP